MERMYNVGECILGCKFFDSALKLSTQKGPKVTGLIGH